MLTGSEVLQLAGSLIWLLAGVGVFIVGMNFMSDALKKSGELRHVAFYVFENYTL